MCSQIMRCRGGARRRKVCECVVAVATKTLLITKHSINASNYSVLTAGATC